MEILNGTENTEEAMEAEIFTQDENDVRLKSLKQMRKWLTGLSDSTDDDDGSIHRENNVRLPRIELPMVLSALGIDTKACDFIWVHILSEKLDSETAKEWQLTK